jgi:serine protease Do
MQATGSGFFISPDGYIVTNNHVVEGADTITVRTGDDRTLKAKLIGRDPATDLAVIKVEGSRFPFVNFEDKGKPRVGDWVVAVGNPFNLGGTATAGIVSALARPNISGSSYVDYMQIDAPINRGNSGGPSFDLNGRVVGVNAAIFSPSGGSVGIGFDIPADVAQQVTRELISGGKVVRGYIGATVQPVTEEIAESLGIKGDKGALVAELTPGGPAARAGLQTGDLVTRIDGLEVKSNADLTRRVGMVRVGQDIHLTVLRDGRVQEITIRAGERPPEDALARNDRRDRGFEGPLR